jgi:ABC-type transport system involved in multi-copper enzyme maturation permease subunit
MLWKNPVLVREIRTRMRGRRAFMIITAHLLILSAIIFLTYVLYSASTGGNLLEQRRTLSKVLFGLLISLEMMMISFAAPALTSGMISSEREHQTFDLLQVTQLKPLALVFGKYLSGLSFILLLLFTAIPLQSPAFLIGGVLPEEIIIGALILVVSAITFTAIGLFFSSLFKRTLVSTVASYALTIFVVFGIPIFGLFVITIIGMLSSGSNFVENISPLIMVIVLIGAWLAMSITPSATIIGSEVFLLEQNSIWLVSIDVPNATNLTLHLPSPWILYLIIYTLLSFFLLLGSVLLVRRVES